MTKITTINSIIDTGMINQFTERAKSCSKIRVDSKDVEKTIKKLFSYVDRFNSLDVYSVRVLEREFSDIEIINELAPFIIPRSVRMSVSDINAQDLLVRPAFNPVESTTLSYDEFMNLQITFRGYFKKDVRTDITRLSDLKIDDSLQNVIPRMAIQINDELRVRYLTDAFVPLLLKPEIQALFREQYFNACVSEVISDYLAPAIF